MKAVALLVGLLDKAQSDRLVLHPGERPHVWVDEGRRDVSAAEVSPASIRTLCAQLLSASNLDALDMIGHVEQTLTTSGDRVVAVARRTAADVVRLEIVRDRAAVKGDPPAAGGAASAAVVDDWLTRAALRNATAIYLRAQGPASMRVNDGIESLGPDEAGSSLLDYFISGEAVVNGWQQVQPTLWQLDHRDLGSIRCRSFVDDQGLGLVVNLRAIGAPALRQRLIPKPIRHVCEVEDGLVVVWGPVLRDTLAMAAATAEWSAARRGGHVISIDAELHMRLEPHIASAFVSQRCAGEADTSFVDAIARAVEEQPDILVLAPVNAQVSEAALTACAPNRLVIAAVVARTAAEALRLLALDNRAAQAALAVFIRGLFNCRSLRRLGGGRIVLRDVVMPSTKMRALLAAGDFDGVEAELRERRSGIRTLDEAMARAIGTGAISLRQAAGHASDVTRLVQQVRTVRRRARSIRPLADPKPEDPSLD